jgi:toxin ParE1/3/4
MSARSARVVLTPKARSDYRAILLHSRRVWGERQRDAYKAHLDRALDNLRHYPEIGPQRDDLPGDYRSLSVEQHLIFYRIEADKVRVVRIVHGRMDAATALAEAESP